jgi:hypothetical protein
MLVRDDAGAILSATGSAVPVTIVIIIALVV